MSKNWLHEIGAKAACKKFGTSWAVNTVYDGSLVCTQAGTKLDSNARHCHYWRWLVWKDQAMDRFDSSSVKHDCVQKYQKASPYASAGQYFCEDNNNGPCDGLSLGGKWAHDD